jgi:hypothetical protein
MEFVGTTTKIPAQISQMRFSLPLAGKRRALPMKQTPHREETAEIKTATAMSFSHGSRLLFLKDKHSKLSFLVDSGATLSILPCSSYLAQSSLGQMAPTFPLGDFKNIPWPLETKLSHMIFFLPKWQPPF